MRQSYFISDLHLGHKNILEYSKEERPFASLDEHDDFVIESINSTVNKHDTLYILGDVAFTREALQRIDELNAQHKILILGNHDKFPMANYIFAGFDKVFGVVRHKEFILSHIPVHTCQLETRYSANIHGHLHTYDVEDQTRYFNCNVDRIGFTPVTLSTIRDTIKYNMRKN